MPVTSNAGCRGRDLRPAISGILPARGLHHDRQDQGRYRGSCAALLPSHQAYPQADCEGRPPGGRPPGGPHRVRAAAAAFPPSRRNEGRPPGDPHRVRAVAAAFPPSRRSRFRNQTHNRCE
jgi:hypothetical protein